MYNASFATFFGKIRFNTKLAFSLYQLYISLYNERIL
jgi:hypothetical protein